MTTTRDKRLQVIVDIFADIDASVIELGGNLEGVALDLSLLGQPGWTTVTVDDEADAGHYVVTYCWAGDEDPKHDHADHDDVARAVPIEKVRETVERQPRETQQHLY